MSEAAVPMDPRIKERRIAVQRDAGRRRLKALLVALGVVATGALGVASLQSPLTDVDRVRIDGTVRTDEGAVLRAAGLAGRRQLIDVDPAAVARSVEALPWIADVDVARRWPSGVDIVVTERVAVAVAPVDEAGVTWAQIDGTGRVLTHQPGRRPGLPALSKGPKPGPPGSALDTKAFAALEVAAALGRDLAARTGDVVVLPDDEVELALLPRGRVRMGRPVDLAAKVQALATVLARVDLAGVAVIDLRVPSAPAITSA